MRISVRCDFLLCNPQVIHTIDHVSTTCLPTTLAHMAGRVLVTSAGRRVVLQVSLLKRVMSLAGSKRFYSNETPTHKDPVVRRFAVEGNIGLLINVVIPSWHTLLGPWC